MKVSQRKDDEGKIAQLRAKFQTGINSIEHYLGGKFKNDILENFATSFFTHYELNYSSIEKFAV